MAKCPICDSRKGKRQCVIANGLVCSQCCGTTRKEDLCLDCSYYQKPKRKYNEVPSFTTNQIHESAELTGYSNALEGAFCAYDVDNNKGLKDTDVIRILELLIDKYYFKDTQVDCDSALLVAGFNFVDAVIRENLADVDERVLVKVLAILHAVVKRLTKTSREYMNIIHSYACPETG